MRLFLGSRVNIAFWLALVVLLTFGVVAYRNTAVLVTAMEERTQTRELLYRLEVALSLLKDAETGQRGYLLTGEPHYLLPYEAARKLGDREMGQLRDLAGQAPRQQRRLERLWPLVGEKLDELEQTIHLRQQQGLDAALRVVETGRGQKAMDQIRQVFVEMRQEAEELLHENDRTVAARVRATVGWVGAGSLLSALLLGLANLILQRDIAKRKRVERALRESEARTGRILETANEAFIAMDAGGRVVAWNRQAEVTFGWRRDEAVGRVLAELIIPARHREAHVQGLRRFLDTREAGGMGRRREVTALRRDGREFPVEMTVAALRLGESYVFNAFVHDITARKQAEAESRSAREAAEAANRAKSEFLANMSHEIRTPMNGILGMTELALDTDLSPEQREYLGAVKSSADALLQVINDILDFSKIEAGHLALDPVEFNPRDSLGEVLKTFALRAHRKGLELACHIHPEVPDRLVGDVGRVRQVIVNLVGNAIKFTERGEVVVRAEAREKTADEVCLHVRVQDTGVGIPADRLGHIFCPFVQADGSTTRRYGGTGLGLSISTRLVEMMGGRLWAESEPGRGSTFHFTARLGRQGRSGSSVLRQKVMALYGTPVLVVEDNATNRDILEEMLRSWGLSPTAVDGREAALAALGRAARSGKPFRLVLLDGTLPQEDGPALVEHVRRQPGDAAVVLMLASADRMREADLYRRLGVTSHLTKPVNQSDLLETIQAVLGEGTGEDEGVPARGAGAADEVRLLRPLRILLAEDNAVNQRVGRVTLEKQGHKVQVAKNGLEALAALDEGAFDLVLMDVQMPEMDGLATTAALRAREGVTGRRLPVIAVTAHAMKGDRERCLAAGMDGYVSKPLRPGELDRVIRELVPGGGGGKEGGPVEAAGPLCDGGDLLARLDGDRALLGEVAGLLRAEGERLLRETREALAAGDVAKLQRSAHTLKGAVAFFVAPAADELLRRLEAMGDDNDLTGGTEVLARLAAEMDRLHAALAALAAGDGLVE
jgi:PAS domain S-box-containing protein